MQNTQFASIYYLVALVYCHFAVLNHRCTVHVHVVRTVQVLCICMYNQLNSTLNCIILYLRHVGIVSEHCGPPSPDCAF